MDIHSLHLIILPKTQVAIGLIGFPLLYLLNSFTPWSKGLFVKMDRSYRRKFFASIQVLHWATAGCVIFWLLKNGLAPGDVGLDIHHALISAAVLVTLGCFIATQGEILVGTPLRSSIASDQSNPKSILDLLIPKTRVERFEYVALCMTAGFCEEFLYRGFGVLALKGIGCSNWVAVGLTSLSFALIHGRAAFSPMGIYWVIKGVFYGALFLWSGSLLPVIILHTLWDLALLLKRDKSAPISSGA